MAAPQHELTTVTPTSAVFHEVGGTARTIIEELEPATSYEFFGSAYTTLPQPGGMLRCRLATVNDVHFGESVAGRVDDSGRGPTRSVPDGATPYPVVMNGAAAAEMAAAETSSVEGGGGPFVAVFAKGDLTDDSADEEFAAFEACYRGAFGDRLHAVRGNHDAMRDQTVYAGDRWIALDGVNVALVDTVKPGEDGGTLSDEQIEWLDATADAATDPVLVMGHHPQWTEEFGAHGGMSLDLAATAALDGVLERRDAVVAYAAGHTHRNRVRPAGGGVPSIEVGCVKDFPGVWAEYRVFGGGILQIVHRISSPEALEWSESCRGLYADFGIDYAEYALGNLDDRCLLIRYR